MDAVLISKVSSLKDRIISILYSDSECKTCKKSNKLAIFVLLLSATVLLSALTPGDFKIESDKVTKAFQSQIAVFSTSEVEIVYDHISRVDRNFRRSSLAELQNLAEQYPLLPELRLSLLKALLKAGKHDDARIQAATISRLSNGNFRSHLRLASLYSQNKLYKYAFHWLYKAIENDPDEFNEIHDWRSLRGLRNQSKFSTLERARKRRGLEKLRDDYLIKELLAISESTHTPAPAKGFSALLGTIAANAPDHNHREIAIELLGGLGSEEAYSAIENALTREIDPDIIETAFESIQRFPQKTINSRIEGTCKIIDSPWAVVFSAGILARINPEEASTNLLNVLLLKTDHDCHKYAVYTLSKIPVFGIEALKEVAANHPSDSMKSRAERYLKPDHH